MVMKGGRKMDAAEAVLRAREAAMGVLDDVDLNENGLTKDEEDLVSSIKFGAENAVDDNASSIHRLDEEDELLAEKRREEESDAMMAKQLNAAKDSKKKSNMPMFKVKRKKKKDVAAAPDPKRVKAVAENSAKKSLPDSDSDVGSGGALGGLLGCYG